jgi:Post-segregation antitoxin CcdA
MRMNISVPDTLAEEVRRREVPISAVCQRALRDEVARLAARSREIARGMEKITVDVGEPSLTIGFTGRWLVEPSRDETRTAEDGYDGGAYWGGVALTERGRIAVYTAHCNERWPANLNDYDSLDQAAEHVPANIIAHVAAELGETRVLWRNI